MKPLHACALIVLVCAGARALPAAAAVDPQSGLIVAEGYETVKAQCTSCHSPKLITQNRASREGWLDTIRWMQATQNLRQFDADTEKTLLDYLAKHYAPEAQGRRPPLRVEKWYFLDDAGSPGTELR